MDVIELIKHPHESVKLSLVIPSLHFDKFANFYNSLARTGSHFSETEIIVKIDSTAEAAQYFDLLDLSEFKYKILIYPGFNGRYSCLHFYNDMAAISTGDIIWQCPEDAEIIYGDWFTHLTGTRDRFKDNIYCIAIAMDNGKGTKQIIGAPAITKEWFNVMQLLSPMPNTDRWLHELPKSIGRRIAIKAEDLLMHFPEGGRVLSKQARKDIYRPALKQAVKRFTKIIS